MMTSLATLAVQMLPLAAAGAAVAVSAVRTVQKSQAYGRLASEIRRHVTDKRDQLQSYAEELAKRDPDPRILDACTNLFRTATDHMPEEQRARILCALQQPSEEGRRRCMARVLEMGPSEEE